jgi:thiol:disulfide interchange protein DsbG
MRSLIALSLVAAVPAMAEVPPPHCALAVPATAAASDHPAAASPAASSALPPAAEKAAPASIRPSLSPELAALPFVQHVAGSGGTITDLGASHGMHAIAAKNGDQFMLFEVTGDGQFAISGAPVELTPAQLHIIAAGNITDLGFQHGLQGYFVRSGPQFQVFYATPDAERVMPGVMWDAAGKDLTKRQIAGIPGVVPTVEVSDLPTNSTAAARNTASAATSTALPLLQKAAFGTIGNPAAPRLFMLIDPQCIYSIRAFQELQSFVASGRVQIAVIPLSVLDYEDQGQSSRSALALLSKPADQLVGAWRSGDVKAAPAPDAARRLQENMAIAQALKVTGTPTFVWRKSDGMEGRIDGVPVSMEALVASMGG